LFRPESRQIFRILANMGLTDAVRVFNKGRDVYTFWDYFQGSWQNNKGIRIDHFLVSPRLADRLTGCAVDTDPRSWDKASDHTPVVMTLRD
jgi:exodeoxyribonuclease-3